MGTIEVGVFFCLHFVSTVVFFVLVFFFFLNKKMFFVFLVFSSFLLNFVAQQTFVISCTVFLIYCISDTDAYLDFRVCTTAFAKYWRHCASDSIAKRKSCVENSLYNPY